MSGRRLEWDWYPGTVPANVELGEHAYIETSYSFLLFRSRQPGAVTYGRAAATYLGTMFDLGPDALVRFGDYTLVHGAWIIADQEVRLGSHCMVSWNVVIMDTYRVPADAESRRAELVALANREFRRPDLGGAPRPVIIGNNVWLGFNACVLPGTVIGDGCVIGAQTVVSGRIPPYSVVAGNPGRIVKQLAKPPESP